MKRIAQQSKSKEKNSHKRSKKSIVHVLSNNFKIKTSVESRACYSEIGSSILKLSLLKETILNNFFNFSNENQKSDTIYLKCTIKNCKYKLKLSSSATNAQTQYSLKEILFAYINFDGTSISSKVNNPKTIIYKFGEHSHEIAPPKTFSFNNISIKTQSSDNSNNNAENSIEKFMSYIIKNFNLFNTKPSVAYKNYIEMIFNILNGTPSQDKLNFFYGNKKIFKNKINSIKRKEYQEVYVQ